MQAYKFILPSVLLKACSTYILRLVNTLNLQLQQMPTGDLDWFVTVLNSLDNSPHPYATLANRLALSTAVSGLFKIKGFYDRWLTSSENFAVIAS